MLCVTAADYDATLILTLGMINIKVRVCVYVCVCVRRVLGQTHNVQVAGRLDQVGEPGRRGPAAAGPGQGISSQGEAGGSQYRSLSFIARGQTDRVATLPRTHVLDSAAAPGLGLATPRRSPPCVKAAFHDTDTDSLDMPTSLRPTRAISSRGCRCVGRVGEDISVRVVECDLYRAADDVTIEIHYDGCPPILNSNPNCSPSVER